MSALPVIAVFDVGKTNKKLFLFDEQYRIVFEKTARLTETVDEDGFPCENLESLRLSTFDSLHQIFRRREFQIRAINFATYGASLVHLDREGQPLTPLYNYLKDYPAELLECFYEAHGGRQKLAMETASPVLGNLNSGLQLYRIKQQQPKLFRSIRYSLHLPQYMSYLLTGHPCTDMTSIGCHTQSSGTFAGTPTMTGYDRKGLPASLRRSSKGRPSWIQSFPARASRSAPAFTTAPPH